MTALDTEPTEADLRTIAALDRIDIESLGRYKPHVAYASSMSHVKPGVRKRVPQSSRQRMIDMLGQGYWAAIIRRDLQDAGLIPRRR